MLITLSILRWIFFLMAMRCGMGYWQKIFIHAVRFKLTPQKAQSDLKTVPVPLFIRDGGRVKAMLVLHGKLLGWCAVFLIAAIITEVLTLIYS